MALELVVAVTAVGLATSPFLDVLGAFANENAATVESSAAANRVLKLVMCVNEKN